MGRRVGQESHRRSPATCPRCAEEPGVGLGAALAGLASVDLRDPGQELDLPFGAPSLRLPAG